MIGTSSRTRRERRARAKRRAIRKTIEAVEWEVRTAQCEFMRCKPSHITEEMFARMLRRAPLPATTTETST
jgi:hypothetical protein